jgi:hypothetical protein
MNQLHFNIKFTCHYRLFVSINIKWRRQKFINKNRFFSFVNNSCSYWQKSTKFHAEVHYTDLHNILKIFKVLLTSTIFPPTVPFDPVSHFTPVSPIFKRIFTHGAANWKNAVSDKYFTVVVTVPEMLTWLIPIVFSISFYTIFFSPSPLKPCG